MLFKGSKSEPIPVNTLLPKQPLSRFYCFNVRDIRVFFIGQDQLPSARDLFQALDICLGDIFTVIHDQENVVIVDPLYAPVPVSPGFLFGFAVVEINRDTIKLRNRVIAVRFNKPQFPPLFSINW